MTAERAPQFYCYGPKPRHVELDPLTHAVYVVLRDARGLFASGGMEAVTVRAALVRDSPALAAALTLEAVTRELDTLRRVGLAETLASAPHRWRKK